MKEKAAWAGGGLPGGTGGMGALGWFDLDLDRALGWVDLDLDLVAGILDCFGVARGSV